MKKRVFIDMDGTLARFHDEEQYLERMFEKGFFRNLKPFEDLIGTMQLFVRHCPDVEVYILSATVDGIPPYCIDEKQDWLDMYLPQIDRQHRIFTKVGENKADYIPDGIHPSDTLIDDYNKNLEEWQAAGGLAVKAKNNINHKGLVGELWKGQLIDITDSPKNNIMLLAAVTNSEHLSDVKSKYEREQKTKALEAKICEERLQDLRDYWNGETNDEETQEWRENLDFWEARIVALWDDGYSDRLERLGQELNEISNAAESDDMEL